MEPSQKSTSDQSVLWNPKVKLILADVDQTVADDFMPAEEGMVEELAGVLGGGCALFFITGSPLNRLRSRLIDRLPAELRSKVLVSHCSGAEVWGFDSAGNQLSKPFYSLYDETLNE